jgi:hypothetical protein
LTPSSAARWPVVNSNVMTSLEMRLLNDSVVMTLGVQGGMYVLQLMDHYSAGFGVLLIALIECIAINWVYGIKLHTFN